MITSYGLPIRYLIKVNSVVGKGFWKNGEKEMRCKQNEIGLDQVIIFHLSLLFTFPT